MKEEIEKEEEVKEEEMKEEIPVVIEEEKEEEEVKEMIEKEEVEIKSHQEEKNEEVKKEIPSHQDNTPTPILPQEIPSHQDSPTNEITHINNPPLHPTNSQSSSPAPIIEEISFNDLQLSQSQEFLSEPTIAAPLPPNEDEDLPSPVRPAPIATEQTTL